MTKSLFCVYFFRVFCTELWILTESGLLYWGPLRWSSTLMLSEEVPQGAERSFEPWTCLRQEGVITTKLRLPTTLYKSNIFARHFTLKHVDLCGIYTFLHRKIYQNFNTNNLAWNREKKDRRSINLLYYPDKII